MQASMMRRLHAGLGIPVAVLLQEPVVRVPENPASMEWKEVSLVTPA